MSPLVAVTTTSIPEAGPDNGPAVYLYAQYLAPLERVGLVPVLVTPSHHRPSVEALMERVQGLMLPGGEDVSPALYGERATPELGMVNPVRDAVELRAVEVAIRRRIPILGLCRGCHLLNVHFGGTLYQDLPSRRLEEVERIRHRQAEPWFARSHPVRVERGSRLHSAVGAEELQINSFHHQGVKELGEGLRVVARAADGLVEGVESDQEEQWLVGVQWHAERHEAHAPTEDPDRRLFAAFQEAVRERADGD